MENSSVNFYHNYSGMEIQNPRPQYFSQYESPNIVIQPTFSFVTKEQPPVKKLKLDKECEIDTSMNNIKILSHQGIKKNEENNTCNNTLRTCMPTLVANKSSMINNKNNKLNNNSSSSWPSNCLHSIGQSQCTASKSKIPIVCIPDRGNNNKEANHQNLEMQNYPTDNENPLKLKIESKDDIDDRVKTLLSSILPKKEAQKSEINTDLKTIQSNVSENVSRIDKSPSKILIKKPLPSIKKFRIPKIKSNPSNCSSNLKCEKNNQIQTRQDVVKNKNILPKTSNLKQNNSITKTIPNQTFNFNYRSTDSAHIKNLCSATVQNTDNKRQKRVSKEITQTANKEKENRRQMPHYKQKERSTVALCKVTKSSNQNKKPLSSRKLILKVNEKREHICGALHNCLKRKLHPETNDTQRNRKYKTNTLSINSNKDLAEIINQKKISRQSVNINQNKKTNSASIGSNLQVENKNQNKKSTVKSQKKHNNYDKIKTGIMADKNCRCEVNHCINYESSKLYTKDGTKPTCANTNDNINYISKKLTVKSVVRSTNNLDLNIHSKTNVQKYPVIEDLRKKLNRAKKRRSIVSKPNTINDQSRSKTKPNTQNVFKEPKIKTIKLIINLICEKPKSKKLEDTVKNNESCHLANVDLSFLDDFNIDDIVDSLNINENDSKVGNMDSKIIGKTKEHSESPNFEDDARIVDVKLHSFIQNRNKIGENSTKTFFDRETCDIADNAKISLPENKVTYNIKEIKQVTVSDENTLNNLSSFTSKKTTIDKVDSSINKETQNKNKKETIDIVRNEGPITDNLIQSREQPSTNKQSRIESTSEFPTDIIALDEDSTDNLIQSRTQPSTNKQSKIICKSELPIDIIVLDEDAITDTLINTSTQQTSQQGTGIYNDVKDINVNRSKCEKTQKQNKLKIETGNIVLDHGLFSEQLISPNKQQTSNRKQEINDEIEVNRSKTTDIKNRNELTTEVIVLDDDSNPDTLIISNSQQKEQNCKTNCVKIVQTNVPLTNKNNIETKNENIKSEIIELDKESIPDTLIVSNQPLTSNKTIHNIYNNNNQGFSKLLSIISNISNKKPNTENENRICETDGTNVVVSNNNLFTVDTKHSGCNESLEKSNQNIISTKNNYDDIKVKKPERESNLKIQLTCNNNTNKTSNKNIDRLSQSYEVNMETIKTEHDCEYSSTSSNEAKRKLDVIPENSITGEISSVRNIDESISTLSNFAQIDNSSVISFIKINENVNNRMSNPSNACKVLEPACLNQNHDSSNSDVKVGNETGKKGIYSNVTAGLLKTPYEESLCQNLTQRMLAYLGMNYDIGTLIRRGKYSKIFQCTDSKLNKYVVKVLNKEQDRFLLGLQKENILNDLQKDIPKRNQHIVYLFNGFGMAERWCFLMEYYPKNLKQVFNENQECFHINMVQKLSRQLVSAVTVLRNNNIVHSSIKPEHVLINDSLDHLKLCGFDECRSVDEVVLLPNIGTPSYRAPELILGYSDGFSIDVWSTALVMYEMATGGRKLFPGMFNNDILYKQMNILGDIPFEMVQSSIYKDHHFFGTQFMRKQGYLGKDIVYIFRFIKSNAVAQNIYNSYNKTFGRTRTSSEKIIDKKKNRMLADLLYQMLILDPQQRLPIEFVYASPFIFETYNDNFWLHC